MNTPEKYHIEKVSTDRHIRDFLDLPHRLHRDDPVYTRPLQKMARMQFDNERHPFFQHALRELWLCYKGALPVGRIAAIKDDLHNDYYSDSIGFFGFFETINDTAVVDTLIATASNWLLEQKCTLIRGPVNPSMKGEFGVLIDGNQYPPYVMMGHSPKRYDDLLRNNGFSVAKQFFAFRIQPQNERAEHKVRFERLKQAEQKIMRRYPQLHFKSVDRHSYENTLREINELGNVVRRHGWGFVPLTEPELQFMINNLRRVIRFDMIHVAYWEDRLVGFIVNIPDINWVLRKTVGRADWLRMLQMPYWIKRCPRSRVIALGVHEDYRKKGIAIMLIKRLTDLAHTYDEWEFSWVAEDNLKSIGAIDSVIDLDKYKTYRLYEKLL